MNQLLFSFLALVFICNSPIEYAIEGDTEVKVNVNNIVVEHEKSLIGANIEDINFQLYGGLYSQLIHGECFEEHVDPSELLGLNGRDRLAVWVIMDEQNRPILTYNAGTSLIYNNGRSVTGLYGSDGLSFGRRAIDVRNPKLGSLKFTGGVLLPEELPEELRKQLMTLATGDAQVSRHWRPVQIGTATGSFKLVRQGVLTGNQAQQIRYISGKGEFGIDNAGLFRAGIKLEGGKSYEGLLRIKSDKKQKVYISLRSETGKLLAEKSINLVAKPGEYQRLTFSLTPGESDTKGRFAVTLRQPGIITVDYAFLQAGEWGRYKSLPVRKELAEALLSVGVKTIRYNGSMNDRCPEPAYRWKEMIGPRDERHPYQGFFNPYASHGFTVFDMMDFGEAAGILPMFGLNPQETEQDMADFIDYCLGGPETTWGKRRISDGHPKPYFLKAIQIGNEQYDAAYFDRFKSLAGVIWKKNPDIDVVLSCNIDIVTDHKIPYIKELVRWCRTIGQEKRLVLDSHYSATLDYADKDLDIGIGLNANRQLAEEFPGFSLRLWPMEENGNSHDWARGLAHAHNLNTMNRMSPALERAGTANTFQAWDMFRVWNQGRIHFTPSQIIFQSPYYVDRMFADEWLPLVVQAECASKTLDVLAKKSRDGKTLTLYLVNIADTRTVASIDLIGFKHQNVKVTSLQADLKAINTPDNPTNLVPQNIPWDWVKNNHQIELQAYSFTVVRLSK